MRIKAGILLRLCMLFLILIVIAVKRVISSSEPIFAPLTTIDNIEITWIPNDLTSINELRSENTMLQRLYIGSENRQLTLFIFTSATSMAFDIEDAEVTNIRIDKHEARLVSKNGINKVIWTLGDTGIALDGNLPVSEMLQIAENTKLNKEFKVGK